MKILGIDPGLQKTGWGIIISEGSSLRLVEYGTISTNAKDSTSARLRTIDHAFQDIVSLHEPDQAAIEETFVNNNPVSSLKLGQARGVAMASVARHGMDVAEYKPNVVKKSIVGAGHAQKTQMIMMVSVLLNCQKTISADEADALAVAICHSHHAHSYERLAKG